MKKTFMYEFIPSKAEEEACKASNTPWVVSRELIEIRDIYPVPINDPQNPWQIKKVITPYEKSSTRLMIPFAEAFEHVFRYWTLETTRMVTIGHVKNVCLIDVTEENNPNNFEGASIEKLPNDNYILVCEDLFKDRELDVHDEIGLYWDPNSSNLKFKLIKKGHV